MDIVKLISKNRLFENLEPNEINAIFDCLKARIVKYERGQVVAKAGTPATEIGIVLSGALYKYKTALNGNRIPLEALEAGGMYGEIAGYLPDNTLPYSIVAVDKTTVLFITVSTIVCQCEKHCEYHQKVLTNTLQVLAESANKLKEDSEYLIIKSMRLKIATLVYNCYLDQRNLVVHLGMNRNEMAEYLNVSRPSMSREMMRMRDEGILDFWKDKITIFDLDKLIAIVKGENLSK